VKLSKFDRENAITFVPPDGKFILMTYRISDNFTLPFKIMCIYSQENHKTMTYNIKLKSIFDSMFFAQNVVLKIPVPENTVDVTTNVGKGKAKYEADKHAIMWRVKKFLGENECMLRAEVTTMEEGFQDWQKPPLKLEFNVRMLFSNSRSLCALLLGSKFCLLE
jgi:AP-2 complex subunit mu-1